MTLFAGRVAVITGAAEGIGRGIATTLAGRGVHLVLLDTDAENLAVTESLVQARSAGCEAIVCDVGDAVQVRAAFDRVGERFDRIDYLINNAGYWDDSRITHGTFESQTAEFERAMGASVFGTYYCTLAALDGLRASSDANVLNIITDHIKPGFYLTGTQAVGYDSGKFGIWRLTETWAQQLAPLGIRVNGLCFGAVDTPMLRGVTMDLMETAMMPEEIGQAVLNLLAHGPGGPTGETPFVAKTHEDRERGLAEIAALGPGGVNA